MLRTIRIKHSILIFSDFDLVSNVDSLDLEALLESVENDQD